MAFNSIPEYTTSAATNTDIGGVSIAEGWPATNINNSERQLLAQLKMECAYGQVVASASTVDISTIHACRISGTTTITTFTITDGTTRWLTFQAACPITYDATKMVIQGGQSVTMAAGDMALVEGIGVNQARLMIFRANGSALGADQAIAQMRLTLTSGVAVTTTDVTAAATVYLTPYKGGRLSLYTGSGWRTFQQAELSIAVPATTNTMYDVFADFNSGTPQLAVLPWTNTTTRATALALQDNVLVKSGTPTQRYMGSFATTGTSGQTEDSLLNRLVWNYYNRISRTMKRREATASWNYTTATFRQANAATANQVTFVRGLDEDIVDMSLLGAMSSAAAAVANGTIGFGLDSTTAVSADSNEASLTGGSSGGTTVTTTATYRSLPGIGRHSLVWLEKGAASSTDTWIGTVSSGINGYVMA